MMDKDARLRDRRSMNLSTSSISSTGSVSSEPFYTSTNEKESPSPPQHALILPTFATKEYQSRRNPRARSALIIRLSTAICGIIVLWRIASGWSTGPANFQISREDIIYTTDGSADDHNLPDEPSVLTVSDNHGRFRWTVHIPHNYDFPLRSRHSQEICMRGDSLRDSLSTQSQLIRGSYRLQKQSYYSADKMFLEIDEAEDVGILPQTTEPNNGKVCEKSLTFILEDDDASLGWSLLNLWLSYGLARQEGRAFFVDDTRWAYGDYTSYFTPLPSQGCAQPPPHQILPCPHSARHLLVSSVTLRWTFGSSFEQEFIQWNKKGVEKSRRIYDLLRRGYEDLFHLTGENALYASSRIAKFKEEANQNDGAVIGIHIRRGDLHPFEHQFSQDYLQLEWYGDAARKLLRAQLQISDGEIPKTFDDFETISKDVRSPLLLATDDPELFNSGELMQSASPFVIQKAQERIQLATKSSLDRTSPAEAHRKLDSVYRTFVDENTGWEGGFFSALFFSLGNANSKHGEPIGSGRIEEEEDKLSLERARGIRELVGRAYILDIAVLGQSDGIVCAISSATCRLLGVALGFHALQDGRWVNIDDNRDGKRVWSWDGRK